MKRSMMALGLLVTSHAAAARHRSAAELLRDVKRLSVVGTVLYVAAHPDDENTRLLAYFANEKLMRTAYLSMTRGEGGQNLIGSEQGPQLGMIRTQELLAARRIDGAEQFFTRARDFGFSKSVDETLATWGAEDALADVVWVIRKLRPDVIITRFPLEAGDTHGHHTASARLAVEAFRAAADPAFHPEQLKQVGTWQAKRIVWNAWNPDPKAQPDLGAPKTINAGVFSPLLGVSYGEMAAESRSMHKSQGFGATPVHGPAPETFKLLAGDDFRDLLDGINLSWSRVPGSTKVAQLVAQAAKDFKVESPASTVPTLLLALEELRKLPDNPWKEIKSQEISELLGDCAGLFVEAASPEFTATPGGRLDVTVTALNRSVATVSLVDLHLTGGNASFSGAALDKDKPFVLKTSLQVPVDASLSNPYWLDSPPAKGMWTVPHPEQIGVPEQPSPLQAEFIFRSGDHTFSITRPVIYKWTDPTAGERTRSIEVVPAVLVNPDATLLVFPDGTPKELRVVVKSACENAAGQLRTSLPAGWQSEPSTVSFTLAKKGQEEEFRFRIRPVAHPKDATSADKLQFFADVDGQVSRGIVHIEHSHIPIQTLLPTAEVKLVRFDLAKGKTRLGYIPGAGDEVPAALRQVGYEVTLLNDEALRTKSLHGFDAILVGIRAYNTNPRMPAYYARLMEYVSSGGTLVVQYNTSNWLSSVPAEIGPYPFQISQTRVTDETAEMKVDVPKHRVVAAPNALKPADFEGWVQERGLYFASKWDDHYETVFSMHDPGEAAAKGGLLIAKYGKGTFVYTGISFFRQLPAGVPGAYRLLANLLAYGH